MADSTVHVLVAKGRLGLEEEVLAIYSSRERAQEVIDAQSEHLRACLAIRDVVVDHHPSDGYWTKPPALEAAVPNDSRLKGADYRRDEILATEAMLDDEAVSLLLGEQPSLLRRSGQILGLWDGARYMHPAFQFDGPNCAIRRGVSELLALLPQDRDGWHQAFWLFEPHVDLGGLKPTEALLGNPNAVLKAAKSSFQSGGTD